ncbi:MAG TPA: orotidine-5'-phosphate decarboxylase [Opitutaceae bacterium]|nr:orotidine-5'-phosphate decarboxylase [Opitutaceae bacterium]
MACELILALDAPAPRDVALVLRQLGGRVRWVKIGLEMFTACGPDCVREVADLGFKVFLDLKLHDIPHTVARAVESAGRLPIGMLTLHAAGGRAMLRQAVDAQRQAAPHLLLLGVTVLTSLDGAALRELGVDASPETQVGRLARLAVDAGVGGIVCSPLEIAPLRAQLSPNVKLVAPGIRPVGSAGRDDQARVMNPAEAARAGADFIVVGRPVLKAPDPAAAAGAIIEELGSKSGQRDH